MELAGVVDTKHVEKVKLAGRLTSTQLLSTGANILQDLTKLADKQVRNSATRQSV